MLGSQLVVGYWRDRKTNEYRPKHFFSSYIKYFTTKQTDVAAIHIYIHTQTNVFIQVSEHLKSLNIQCYSVTLTYIAAHSCATHVYVLQCMYAKPPHYVTS